MRTTPGYRRRCPTNKLLRCAEILQARLQLCSAAGQVIFERDRDTFDSVTTGTAGDGAVAMSGYGATAGIANASDRNPAHLEVRRTRTDHLTPVGRGVAQPNNFAHGCPDLLSSVRV